MIKYTDLSEQIFVLFGRVKIRSKNINEFFPKAIFQGLAREMQKLGKDGFGFLG